MEWRPAGWLVCLPLLVFPCTIKSRSSLLAPAHPGHPGKRAVKRFTTFSHPGQFAPKSESANSTLANSLPGTSAPQSEMARKLATKKIYSYVYAPRKFQGMKWPGSERARERKDRERIGPGPIGRFAPPSESARERKGSVPVKRLWRWWCISYILWISIVIRRPLVKCGCADLRILERVRVKIMDLD